MELYKYTSFELGKVIIETSQIALSKPEWFNDPFDCVPVLGSDEMQKAIDVMNGYLLDKQIFHMLQALKGNLKKFQHRVLIFTWTFTVTVPRRCAQAKCSAYSDWCWKHHNERYFSYSRHGKAVCRCDRCLEKYRL